MRTLNLRSRGFVLLLVAATSILASGPRAAIAQPNANLARGRSYLDRGIGVKYKGYVSTDQFGRPTRQFAPGLYVFEVKPGKPAARAGIRKGDVVLLVNGIPVNTPQVYSTVMQRTGRVVRLLVQERRNGNRKVELRVTREIDQDNNNGQPQGPAVQNLNGVWHSTLGTTTLFHNGNTLSGTVSFPFGGSSQIIGTVNGNAITYAWTSRNPDGQGSGSLSVAANGRTIQGQWRNTLDGTSGNWVLWR